VDHEDVLRHILTAARDLVNARYAAIGVVAQDRLVRFLHSGVPEEQAARIGGPPEGKGVLGALIDRPDPIRIRDIAQHPASVGFPAGHPSMGSLLGVPIRVGERLFGTLYLADRAGGGQFTREDEDLVTALAAAAGVALENASLFAEARRRRAWQSAMISFATELLTGTDPDEALRQVVRQLCRAISADGGGYCTLTGDPEWLRMTVAEDLLAPWHGELFPMEQSLPGAVVSDRNTMLVPKMAADPRTAAMAEREPRIGATMAAPVVGDGRTRGALLMSRRAGAGSFDPADLDMISAFASQAAFALDLADTRRDNERIRLLEDRQRVAVDLQYTVIRRLFALGLSLEGLASRTARPAVRQALSAKVDELDTIIADVRAAVFALDRPGQSTEGASRSKGRQIESLQIERKGAGPTGPGTRPAEPPTKGCPTRLPVDPGSATFGDDSRSPGSED